MQVITIAVTDLMQLINNERECAYAAGYIKAQNELKQVAKSPVFPEVLRGVKELNRYLAYKGYWLGSVDTLNKKTTDLRELGEKQGKGLIFRCGVIDKKFKEGFSFKPLPRKVEKSSQQNAA